MRHLTYSTAAALMLSAGAAEAYIGPGAGLTAIGAVVGILGAVVLLVVGCLWYPVKKLLKRNRGPETVETKAAE